jgi:hypothetical protein
MARQRKQPTTAMIEAEQNIAGMKAIDPALDLENGVSVAAGEAILAGERVILEEYNSLLAQVDAKLNQLTAHDRLTRAFNKKVKPAVGLRYGTEFERIRKGRRRTRFGTEASCEEAETVR